ncbi:hypothetical protein ACKKBG_A03780 [Auxenochlorella protothecoides x Auxenochlorella symbiontica]
MPASSATAHGWGSQGGTHQPARPCTGSTVFDVLSQRFRNKTLEEEFRRDLCQRQQPSDRAMLRLMGAFHADSTYKVLRAHGIQSPLDVLHVCSMSLILIAVVFNTLHPRTWAAWRDVLVPLGSVYWATTVFCNMDAPGTTELVFGDGVLTHLVLSGCAAQLNALFVIPRAPFELHIPVQIAMYTTMELRRAWLGRHETWGVHLGRLLVAGAYPVAIAWQMEYRARFRFLYRVARPMQVPTRPFWTVWDWVGTLWVLPACVLVGLPGAIMLAHFMLSRGYVLIWVQIQMVMWVTIVTASIFYLVVIQ